MLGHADLRRPSSVFQTSPQDVPQPVGDAFARRGSSGAGLRRLRAGPWPPLEHGAVHRPAYAPLVEDCLRPRSSGERLPEHSAITSPLSPKHSQTPKCYDEPDVEAPARRPSLPPDDAFARVRQRKAVPHQFVLDALAALSPTTRPMFGCLAVYVADKIVLILRDKPDITADNRGLARQLPKFTTTVCAASSRTCDPLRYWEKA